MLGAIIGDMVGSVYEWHNIKTKDFPLFGDACLFTDGTVRTIATADAIMNGGKTEMKKLIDPILDITYLRHSMKTVCRLGLPPQRYGDCRIRNITGLLGSIYRPTHGSMPEMIYMRPEEICKVVAMVESEVIMAFPKCYTRAGKPTAGGPRQMSRQKKHRINY